MNPDTDSTSSPQADHPTAKEVQAPAPSPGVPQLTEEQAAQLYMDARHTLAARQKAHNDAAAAHQKAIDELNAAQKGLRDATAALAKFD